MNTTRLNLVFANAWYITSAVLFSCGHWIGGSACFVIGAYMSYERHG